MLLILDAHFQSSCVNPHDANQSHASTAFSKQPLQLQLLPAMPRCSRNDYLLSEENVCVGGVFAVNAGPLWMKNAYFKIDVEVLAFFKFGNLILETLELFMIGKTC